MKRQIKSIVSILLVFLCLFSLAACNQTPADPWESARYIEYTELGSGSKTVLLEVKVEEHTVLFTVKTDESTVGAALLANGLIEGEDGAYGLYVKKVNGITADYDVDQTYWAFYENGEYALSGVDQTEIKEGVTYQLVYSKG